MMDRDYDVIVVGGGGAGLAAALMANAQGASCIIVEADGKLGGATAQSGGVFYAAGTQVQRAAGITDDTPQALYDYLMTLNRWKMRPDLVRYYAEHAGEALEWLMELGTEFPPQWLVRSGVDTVARGHSSQGAGSGIADALINAAGAKGIETAYGSRVEELLVEDGRVVGIRAAGAELRAPTVIITTGGFGNNPQMLQRLYPSAACHGDWTWAVHKDVPFALGDGISLAENIGAAVVGHDCGLLLPTSGFSKSLEAFLPPWIIAVNKEGSRFMSELSPYSVCGYLLNEQTERRAWAIFDEQALVEASTNTKYLDPYNAGISIPTWEEPTLREQVRKGRVKVGNTLRELAEQVGIDGIALERTVEVYNRDCANGCDSQFFKQAPAFFPVQQAPFYAVEIRSAIIGLTAAGLDIDGQARVLDAHKRPIPGLYAAGEVLGCFQGERYGGGGLSIGNAVVFGRLAGIEAARAALANPEGA
ncbi:FAD-dependent oxidoreductase [Pseudomonas sp. MAP12]|uniref:FAD-dependent oxidoreductase n=1 Tax=Geopseudomonas aromaticivorans TaxID=2849492 RepID=A0ABS6MWW9_9GAMM|nr:FAD-dependent oxidoreductase [Pseudomonas aromaticivorans]MBV2133299.1 FAD-dependent oxidoreductase [Pseudomonas aromaticivorans]